MATHTLSVPQNTGRDRRSHLLSTSGILACRESAFSCLWRSWSEWYSGRSRYGFDSRESLMCSSPFHYPASSAHNKTWKGCHTRKRYLLYTSRSPTGPSSPTFQCQASSFVSTAPSTSQYYPAVPSISWRVRDSSCRGNAHKWRCLSRLRSLIALNWLAVIWSALSVHLLPQSCSWSFLAADLHHSEVTPWQKTREFKCEWQL